MKAKADQSDKLQVWKDVPVCDRDGLNVLAKQFADHLIEHLVDSELLQKKALIQMSGPMGAGKSTFVRDVLRHLGVSRLAEGSPTFSIAHEYRIEGEPVTQGVGQGSKKGCVELNLFHLDLYRLESYSDFEMAGGEHYFYEREGAWIFVEWLENILSQGEPEGSQPVPLLAKGICYFRVEIDFLAPSTNENPKQENARRIKIFQTGPFVCGSSDKGN